MENNNKTIAKNTIFLYFRMILVMLISLYTSRVVLEALGISNYGIYQAVGGIVALMSFVNNALSTGSSRFITFELGFGVTENLKRTFSTLLIVHIGLAVVFLILCETAGLWYIYNGLSIQKECIYSAVIVFQFSVLTAILNITQVPYSATIIAHEKMDIYAYLSVAEVILKLIVAYMIAHVSGDVLVYYAALMFLVQTLIMMSYRLFCRKSFIEAKLYISKYDNIILKNVCAFSGWSLFAATSISLLENGTLLLLNNFFSPALVAARAISVQVNLTANQFIQNFRTAANPQIVKLYAVGDYEASKHLLLQSTCFSYYLMLLLALPVYLLADPLLHVWLKEVPEYTVVFLQWAMIQSLFSIFDTSFYTALYAKGQLRENALISPTLGFIAVPILYLLFCNGYSPLVVPYVMTCIYFILGIIIKPFLIIKIANYNLADILGVFKRCFWVTAFSVPETLFIADYIDKYTFVGFIEICILTTVVLLTVFITIGMNSNERKMVKEMIKHKLARRNVPVR